MAEGKEEEEEEDHAERYPALFGSRRVGIRLAFMVAML